MLEERGHQPLSTMKRTSRATKHALELAQMNAALPAAVAMTLTHRLPMLMGGLLDPKALDHPEVARMVAEKLTAGGRISTAWLAVPGNLALAWQRYLDRQTRANLALGWPAPPARLLQHSARSLGLLAQFWAELNESSMRTAHATTVPLHDPVVANASRLAANGRRAATRRTARRAPKPPA